MKRKTSRFKHWILRTWTCCGQKWEILLSKSFPERDKWAPKCPKCGFNGKNLIKMRDYQENYAKKAIKSAKIEQNKQKNG